jgi:hypothetical protein
MWTSTEKWIQERKFFQNAHFSWQLFIHAKARPFLLLG